MANHGVAFEDRWHRRRHDVVRLRRARELPPLLLDKGYERSADRSGDVTLPAPTRDLVVDVGRVVGARRVRITASGFETPGGDHGFAEIEVIGDGPDPLPQLWAVTDPQHQLYSSTSIAIGDIDLDGRPEIVAVHEDERLIAFEHDGTFKWKSPVVTTVGWGALSIADLDQDGVPEIVAAGAAFDNQGNRLWDGGQGRGGRSDARISTVADIDLDGRPEVVAGRSAYRHDGTLLWNAPIGDGFPAVADFDDDDQAEIAVVTSGLVYLLEHTGAVKWGPFALPGGGFGGPPTIADVDGDGRPEIGIAGAKSYVVFEHDGTIKWVQPTRDASSNSTGSSVFDFDGDGTAEIVYADEYFLRIYRGATGEVLYALALGSGTGTELPPIADIDGDGHAEIVAIANRFLGGEAKQGVFVVGGAGDTWVSTRKLWNQHDYHVTNVNDDLSIPRVERANWLTAGLNDFRRNSFSPDDQERTESFVYKALDPGSLASAETPVTIEIRSPNGPPDIVSQPQTAAYVGVAYTYAAQATDPDVGDELKWFLLDGPPGMTIGAGDGLVAWTPGAGDVGGSFDVTIRVQDRRGLADLQTFSVTVSVAPTPSPTPVPTASPTPTRTPDPNATPSPTPSPAPQLASIVVEPGTPIVLTGETQAFTATGVLADGTSTNLTATASWASDATGVATVGATGVATGVAAGNATIMATFAGITGSASLAVRARVTGDTTLPTAAITSPATNAEVTGPVDVLGTATDASFLKYELEVAPAGETTFALLARGDAPVAAGALGRLDPTILLNGLYTVRLTVFDRGGNRATASATYLVSGERKIGNFSISFQDVNVALSGVPITVTRTYDSRYKGQGDFGVGWRMEVRTLAVQTNRVLGTGWTTQNAGFNVQLVALDQHYVTITLPDGKVETFDLQLSPTSRPFSLDFTNVVGFVPRPGTLGTLEALENGSLLVAPGGAEVELWDDGTFRTYDPQRFRYTTPTGQKIVLHRSNGVESVTDASGNSLTIGPNGNLLSRTEGGVRTHRFEYDAAGRLVRTTGPRGGERLTTYAAIGDGRRIATSTDENGRVTRYAYDELGNLQTTSFPDGSQETQVRDAEDRVVARTDRDGRTTTFEHDALGRVLKTTHPDGTTTGQTWDAVGRLTSRTDERGFVTTYAYGPNRQTVTDALGNVTVHEFDSQDRRVRTTDALGRVSTFTWDGKGNLTETRFPDGTTKTTSYDLAGRKVAETDQAGKSTLFAYDDAGLLVRVTDAAGGVTEFGYDGVGNQVTQTDAEGRATTLTYDLQGNVLTRTRPLGQQESFTWDAVGNRVSHTDFGGDTTTFAYDGADRLVAKTLPGGTVVTYAYTGGGLRTQAGGEAFSYDLRGRLLEEHKASGEVLSYTYDGAGNKTALTTPQGTITYGYDELGRLENVTDAAGTTTYSYDAVGNLATVTTPNGVVTTHSYDDQNRLTEVANVGPGGVLSTCAYLLGPAGNRIRVSESGAATSGRIVTYGFDDVYRLVSEQIDEPGALGDETITYAYDAVGNRLGKTDAVGTTTYTYDANDRLLIESGPAGTVTSTYDADGNLVARDDGSGVATFAYDAESRLVAADTGTVAVAFGYDADGMCTSRTVGGTTTSFLLDKTPEIAFRPAVCDGVLCTRGETASLARVVVEATGANVTTYTYGHQMIRQASAGAGSHFPLRDGQLSTRQLTTAAGAVSDAYTFDAFGVLRASSGSTPNPYLYTGEELDPNVGFYYLRARWYDAANGRFTSTDPELGNPFEPVSLHRYLYANANPVDNRDPTGRFTLPELSVAQIIGASLAAGALTFVGAAILTRDLARSFSYALAATALVASVLTGVYLYQATQVANAAFVTRNLVFRLLHLANAESIAAAEALLQRAALRFVSKKAICIFLATQLAAIPLLAGVGQTIPPLDATFTQSITILSTSNTQFIVAAEGVVTRVALGFGCAL